jgi:hypothetical protein
MRRLCLTLLALAAVAFTARADDKVWCGVILANNPKHGEAAKDPPPEIAPYVKKLVKVFNCEQFELIGSATKAMDNQTERWLVPTQNFWVGAHATRVADGYQLKLQFYHDKRLLVETEAKLGLGSPLFVRGPEGDRGQIILVFEVRP